MLADHWPLFGIVTLRARDVRVVREVTTSSWLGLEHQSKGYRTEARAGSWCWRSTTSPGSPAAAPS